MGGDINMYDDVDWLTMETRPAELAENRSIPEKRMISACVQEAVRTFNSKGPDFIFAHFDTFLSLIVNGANLEWSIINKGFEYVERSCQQLYGNLEDFLKEKDLENDLRICNLNSLKMHLYLFTSLMKVKFVKISSERAVSLNIGKKGKKALSADAESESEWTESERRVALEAIYNLLQLSLTRLWDPPLPDDSFVDMVARPCYMFMEDTMIRSKTLRETIFQILGILNKKYNHGFSCTIKLVQMVQLYEHAVTPICAGVNQLVTVWALSGLISRLVREFGEAFSSSDAAENANAVDSPSQRRCAQFLNELTQLMPSHMIPVAQAMRPHLETDECYTLRISVLGMMCEILCRELKGEGLSDEKRTMRDEFLEDLEEHIHDLSAYVRSKVLQYWGRLQSEGCVPILIQSRVLTFAIERLVDRATMVRKSAVQLIKAFLEHNPYSAQLSVKHVEEQLVNEKFALESLHQKIYLPCDPIMNKKWDEIENEVKKAVEAKLNEAKEDDVQTTTLSEACTAIRKCLLEEKYQESVSIFRHTEKHYPEAKLLRSVMKKDDQIAYIVGVLKHVFVTETYIENDTPEKEAENIVLMKQYEEKENLIAFLEDFISFSKLIEKAIPLIYTLLMSKQGTDVNEAIDFFKTAHNFNIEAAELGTMGMLQLVWSPDQDKRDAVENAYREMYLNIEGNSDRARSAMTAKLLVKLVQSVNRGQAAALEALLARWLRDGHLPNSVIQIFWEMFTMKHEGTTEGDSVAALNLLVMLSKAKPSVASANVQIIQTIGFAGSYRKKVLSAQMLLSMGCNKQRYEMVDPVFKSLIENFEEVFFKYKKFADFLMASIDAVYTLCDTPDLMCIELLSRVTQQLDEKYKTEKDDGMISYPLDYVERLLFVMGHVAMRQLIHLDVTVYGELRRRNEIREQRKTENIKTKASKTSKNNKKTAVDTSTLDSSSASAAGRMQRLQNQSNASTLIGEDLESAEDVGLEGAVADDADAEFIRAVCEREVVCSGLLSKVTPFLKNLLESSMDRVPQELRSAACLALGRFMLVSSTFCEDNMQLYMSLLKNTTCVMTKCNIIITLSDLTLRFPNVIQPWTPFIYERLEDPCVKVRQCSVKILSFLILQEMVRVRGQVAGLARCCVDNDANTRTMAKLFFKNLSQKGNTLYNVILDIISRLSDPNLALPEDQFRSIMEYIISLIQKDRQMEMLVEKLCLRFKLANDERQWRDLAFCLSLFNYNDRSIRKLLENIDCYRDKLFSKEVYNCFKKIIANVNKQPKADHKALATELNDKIEETFALQEGTNKENEDNLPHRAPATPRANKTPRRRRIRKSKEESDEEDSESILPLKSRNGKKNELRTPSRSSRRQIQKQYNENDSDDSDTENRNSPDKDVFKKPQSRAYRKRK